MNNNNISKTKKKINKSKSLFENYFFNLIKTLSGVLFPVISFAYSSRILGVDGVGQVNFAKSFITYFSMIAMLGINQYGTREAAKVRDDKKKLSEFALEILCINIVTTILAYILLFVAISAFPTLKDYTILLLINSISILLSGMGMEWLYQALEEYRYIAIRAVLFQLLALVLMLIFVRDRNDVVAYAVVNVISTSGSLVINFFHARKYICLKSLSHLEFRRHLPPMLWLFGMAVSIELYTVLDTTMLGFFRGDTAVGLYTAAVKVNRIVNTIITSLGVVLIPRLSYYVGNNERHKLNQLVKKGYNYVFLLSIPAALGLFILSDDIIRLFSGPEFVEASYTMKIITPIVIFIPFSVMTNQQTLVPLGKEKLILMSTGIGAITNIICNSIMIPFFAENGAAVGTIVAEGAVAIVCLRNASIFFSIKDIFSRYYQYWISAIPIVFVGVVTRRFISMYFLRIIVTVICSGLCYSIMLLMFKNIYFIEIYNKVFGKKDYFHDTTL